MVPRTDGVVYKSHIIQNILMLTKKLWLLKGHWNDDDDGHRKKKKKTTPRET